MRIASVPFRVSPEGSELTGGRWWSSRLRRSRLCRESCLEWSHDFQWRAIACQGSPNGGIGGINTLSPLSLLPRDWLNSSRNQRAGEPVDVVPKGQHPEGRDQGGERWRRVLERQPKIPGTAAKSPIDCEFWVQSFSVRQKLSSHIPWASAKWVDEIGSNPGAPTKKQAREASGRQLCLMPIEHPVQILEGWWKVRKKGSRPQKGTDRFSYVLKTFGELLDRFLLMGMSPGYVGTEGSSAWLELGSLWAIAADGTGGSTIVRHFCLQVDRHIHINLPNGGFLVRTDVQRYPEKADQLGRTKRCHWNVALDQRKL